MRKKPDIIGGRLVNSAEHLNFEQILKSIRSLGKLSWWYETDVYGAKLPTVYTLQRSWCTAKTP